MVIPQSSCTPARELNKSGNCVPNRQKYVLQRKEKDSSPATFQPRIERGTLRTSRFSGVEGVEGSETLRALAAELKSRSGTTTFRVNNPEDIQTGEKAARAGAGALARSGCQAVIATQINVEIDPRFDLRGAKLSKMTQALAYAGIKEQKKPVSRKTSDNNVKQVILAVKQEFCIPTTAQVWMSIRHRDFSRQVKDFLWKSLHSAHRLGSFWAHIPQLNEGKLPENWIKEPGVLVGIEPKPPDPP
ncbi:hypothetical protein C8R47DRAFT_1054300 [Mycena vitilis]|nr:hypothetical protein C8R47DRAFT_1054300 [Mycena vitilis]